MYQENVALGKRRQGYVSIWVFHLFGEGGFHQRGIPLIRENVTTDSQHHTEGSFSSCLEKEAHICSVWSRCFRVFDWCGHFNLLHKDIVSCSLPKSPQTDRNESEHKATSVCDKRSSSRQHLKRVWVNTNRCKDSLYLCGAEQQNPCTRHLYLVLLKCVHVHERETAGKVISLSSQVTGTFCLALNLRDNPSLYLGENGRRIACRDGGFFALQFRAVACLGLSWETCCCYLSSPKHH